ncbi:hypothetical protein EKO27_g9671 [Xylaria grammica]|uniref:Uncharacterized protein n=1 Tax=Xylaria grammica TaxID=363999 RepID=A0A439CTG4_9PEZI|nr:hypothetical protein EKO27_g9671 [Xylaria grammica]
METSSNVEAGVASSNPEKSTIDDLFDAIESDDANVIKTILDAHPEMINEQNKLHTKAPKDLFSEGKIGNLLTQDALRHMQSSVDTTTVEHYGDQCPLHVACFRGKAKAVETLLATPGINLNSTNASKETPLGVACRAAQLPIANLLLQESKRRIDDNMQKPTQARRDGVANTPIHVAQRDDVGNTPIHYLVCRGVYPLWQKDPSPRDLKELVPSMLEASKQDPTICDPHKIRDLDAGGRFDEFGRFCMEVACRLGPIHWLESLIEPASNSVNLPDQNGWTALHHAIEAGDSDTVQVLLNAKADTRLPTTEPCTSDAVEFAFARWKYDIAVMIKMHQNTASPKGQEQVDPTAWIWPGNIIPDREGGKPAGGYRAEKLLVSNIIAKSGRMQETVRLGSWEAIWCHFPENNSLYANAPALETGETVLDRLQSIFGSSRRSPPFCSHRFSSRTVDSSASGKDHIPSTKSEYDPRFVVTVLPVIDIDMLDRFTKNTGEQALRTGVHPPRTLDHYYHSDLDGQRLDDLNENQVLSRHIKYLEMSRHKGDASRAPAPGQISTNTRPTTVPERRGGRFLGRLRQPTTSDELEKLESQRPPSANHQPLHKDTGCFTALADSNEQDSQNEDLQQGPQLPDDIQRGFKGLADMKRTYHDMIKISMNYQSSIRIQGQAYTYLRIFSKEVLRVSKEVDQCFDEFKSSLGKADENFRHLSKHAAECLMDIQDVINELEIIKQVLDHRSSIWEDMHNIPSRGQGNMWDVEAASGKCSWGDDTCKPHEIRDAAYGDTDNIERRAKRVQKKANDLMTLLHGQAGTENAIRSSEQARYLAVFTVLAVVFSPLSFVTSLLALQVKSFTPSKWDGGQVTAGLLGTFVLTGLFLLLMKYHGWRELFGAAKRAIWVPFMNHKRRMEALARDVRN